MALTLAQRLKTVMEDRAVTPAELARACRVKPPSVSAWMSGESKSLKAVPLLRAATFLQVDALWLATGEGSPHRVANHNPTVLVAREWSSTPLSAGEAALLAAYRKLPSLERQQVVADLERRAGELEEMVQRALAERSEPSAGALPRKQPQSG